MVGDHLALHSGCANCYGSQRQQCRLRHYGKSLAATTQKEKRKQGLNFKFSMFMLIAARKLKKSTFRSLQIRIQSK